VPILGLAGLAILVVGGSVGPLCVGALLVGIDIWASLRLEHYLLVPGCAGHRRGGGTRRDGACARGHLAGQVNDATGHGGPRRGGIRGDADRGQPADGGQERRPLRRSCVDTLFAALPADAAILVLGASSPLARAKLVLEVT
jgi:hypothetical protein